MTSPHRRAAPSPDPADPKRGEREYYARIGPEGIAHGISKPFTDQNCAINLANMDALFHLLPPPPARLIEFGCGVGWLAFFLAQRGYQVTGVDISPEAIAAAIAQREARRLPNAQFVVADYEEFSSPDLYDCAFFYDALHHAEDEQAALRCAHRVLRDGGMLIAFEPGHGHSQAPDAIRAVNEFGVHEKDMPAEHIVRLAYTAGFRRHLVLPHPHRLMHQLYRPGYARATSRLDLLGRYLLGRLRVLRLLFGGPKDSIVILWK